MTSSNVVLLGAACALALLACTDPARTCADDTATCSDSARASGTDCVVDGDEGTTCGPEAAATLATDCRADLLGTCATGHLCNAASGACEVLGAIDCRQVPSICWEDQTCDLDTGYCAEASLDTELAYDVEVYDVILDVDTTANTFIATEKVFFRATAAGTTSITLDIGKTVGTWTPYAIASVEDHAGNALSFTQDSAKGALKVPLAAALGVGDGEVLIIHYSGPTNPITDTSDKLYNSGLMHRVGEDGTTDVVQTYGWPDLARRWLPSHDHPSDAARAILTVGVNDTSLEPLANGVPVREATEGGYRRRTFLLRQPVPTYALFVGAAPFTRVPLGVVDGISIDAYTYAADASVPTDRWTRMTDALHYLSQRFGAYPFERYAVLEVPDPTGGMEHATVVEVADWMFASHPEITREIAIHEMLHHWWGDCARQRRWEEFWLNESMASYFTMDIFLAQDGADAYQSALKAAKDLMLASSTHYTDDPLRYQHATEDVPGRSTDASLSAPYAKGPWVWHMLRGELGEDTFWAAVKAFYEASRFKKYDTNLLLATLNGVSGSDYTQFFKEWVYGRGWPVLSTSYRYDAARHEIKVTAKQVQTPAWGTYTFTGKAALDYTFDDADPATQTCTVKVSFTGGATTSTATGPCPYSPTTMGTPFTSRILAQIR